MELRFENGSVLKMRDDVPEDERMRGYGGVMIVPVLDDTEEFTPEQQAQRIAYFARFGKMGDQGKNWVWRLINGCETDK